MSFGLAWRMLRRELSSGELRLLFLSLVIAVAAVTAVGFFTDRVRVALDHQAQQLIGGDLVLIGDKAWPEAWRQEAMGRGLKLAETLTFPSMVMANDKIQLAEIKAVSSTYPLRGQLSVSITPGMAGEPVASGPKIGEVWPDERLTSALQLSPKGLLHLGQLEIPVGVVLTMEPDRGFGFFSLAPRLMMRLEDVERSGLVQTGSRITYRLLISGDEKSVADFRDWVSPQLLRGQRLESIENARPEIRHALDRAQRFLGLASLLTVILSAVAVALATRRYLQRHLDACAIMRCLGLTQNHLIGLHATQFFWLALFAAAGGIAIGFATHFILLEWLSGLLAIKLPLPSWKPLLPGLAVAGVLLFGFAIPPLLQLAKVPTLRVLRRELGAPQASFLGGYALGLVLLSGLIVVVAGDLRLGLLAVGGFVIALGGFWLIAQFTTFLLLRIPQPISMSFGWRQGLANFSRHRGPSSIQIVALAVGIMAMLLLTVTRNELLGTWQSAMPLNAPNRFLVNIQPEQRVMVGQALSEAGVVAELSPMVRGRLKSISGNPVSATSFPDSERAQRLVEREFNLSWQAEMPTGNQLLSGHWFNKDEIGTGVASVEVGLAETLKIKLGDTLIFSVAGIDKTVRVTSLRKLDWDSMRVNFFVLMPPGVIEDSPASYITSFFMPPSANDLPSKLLQQFPNLTLIDTSEVIRQIQSMVSQVALAVQFIFVFTLIAGGIVLFAVLLAAFDERRYEISLMRALGANRTQLRHAMLFELAIMGSISGFIAALGSNLLGQFISQKIFEINLPFDFKLLILSMLISAGLAITAGWFALKKLLETPPIEVLRSGV